MDDQEVEQIINEIHWMMENYDIKLNDNEKTKLREVWDIMIKHINESP